MKSNVEAPIRGLWGSMKALDSGHLAIGGCDTVTLAVEFGTPLIVYDASWLRERMREFKRAASRPGWDITISYASKAFCTVAICQMAEQEGLGIDVVSGGELHTALLAGVPPEHIHMHGNNKTWAELEYAVDSGIGLIIVDNFVELEMLEQVALQKSRVVAVLLRVSPGVEAHTHEFISTGQQDSKFGFDLESGQADEAMARVLESRTLACIGLHSHIGSQIFEPHGFTAAIERMGGLYARGLQLGLPFRILNVGGGFGIRYTSADDPLPIHETVGYILDAVDTSFKAQKIDRPEVWLEPGRAIVGPPGTTLYTVGTQKHIEGVRSYVSVDGGMNDNPRPALYGAKYDAAVANRVSDEATERWSVAGKCCESGDMLIWDCELPQPKAGDILALFSTGAYTYSMASHYNRNPKPAVVFVENGHAQVVVERETWADLVRHDRPLTAR